MKIRWIVYVASRYISREKKSSPSMVFAILGIATGVLALTVIISVMNGFQLGFIENILEISSGHLRVENFPQGTESSDLENKIRALPAVASAVRFRDTSVIIKGRVTNPRGALLRGVPPDALELDPGLKSKLINDSGVLESGVFDIRAEDSIVLGSELARHLSVRVGDSITVLGVSGGGLVLEDVDDSFTYRVTGIFQCGFYEYDLGWAFINIDRAARLSSPEEKPVLLVKLVNRWQDQRVIGRINQIIEAGNATGPEVSSWRDYNRTFFGALRTEKLMMFVLVGLIFIVVGLNIYQSQRRAVMERREEIGMLRALGASDIAVRFVFVLDGFIIGFSGAAIGLAAGLLVAYNISVFFTGLETIVNFFISLANTIAGFFGVGGSSANFAVFSPTIFYIKEIPSRVIPHEAVLIFIFGFMSALLAAWFASGRASRTRPAEVLRYE